MDAPAGTSSDPQNIVDCEEFDDIDSYNDFRNNFNNQYRFLLDVTTQKISSNCIAIYN